MVGMINWILSFKFCTLWTLLIFLAVNHLMALIFIFLICLCMVLGLALANENMKVVPLSTL